MRTILALAFCLLAVAFRPAVALDQQTLEIVSSTGVHPFAVEVAVTDAERERGLMYRKELPEGRGMLFDFHRDQEVAFWMKNTYIPLDMIFIRSDGTIARIAEDTTPMSEALVPSGAPVQAVLEVIGGTARKLGIRAGDKVASRILHAH